MRDTFHFRRHDTPASLVTEVFSLGNANKGGAARHAFACSPLYTHDFWCQKPEYVF